MANEKTYKITIDTQVKGTDDVKEMNTQVEESTQKFTRLQKQIKETSIAMQKASEEGNKIEFKRLRKELDELNDKLDATKFASGQLDDQLSAMPGTLGTLGTSFKTFNDVLKVLAKNPIVLTLTIIVGALSGIIGAMKQTKEGTESLTKVTDAFGKMIAPIITFIANLGVPVMNGLADAINWVSSAFSNMGKQNKETSELMNLPIEKLKEYIEQDKKWIKDSEEHTKSLNESIKTTSEGYRKALKEGNIEKQRFYLKELQTIADNDKYLSGELQNKKDRLKLEEEIYKKRTITIKKGTEDLRINGQQQVKDAELTTEQLKTIYGDYYKDIFVNMQQSIKDMQKLQADKDKKDKEDAQKKRNDDSKARENDAKTNLDNRIKYLNDELSFISLNYDEKIELSYQKQEALLNQEFLTESQITEIRAQGAAERAAINASEVENEMNKYAQIGQITEQFGTLMQDVFENNKGLAIAGIIIEKVGSIAQIVANTAIANAKAVAASPLTAGAPWTVLNSVSAGVAIAASVAQAAKSISAINATTSKSTSSGGSSSVSLPKATSTVAPTIKSSSVNANVGTQIASTLNNQPTVVKTYVVSGDVSSAAALDRRTKDASTF